MGPAGPGRFCRGGPCRSRDSTTEWLSTAHAHAHTHTHRRSTRPEPSLSQLLEGPRPLSGSLPPHLLPVSIFPSPLPALWWPRPATGRSRAIPPPRVRAVPQSQLPFPGPGVARACRGPPVPPWRPASSSSTLLCPAVQSSFCAPHGEPSLRLSSHGTGTVEQEHVCVLVPTTQVGLPHPSWLLVPGKHLATFVPIGSWACSQPRPESHARLWLPGCFGSGFSLTFIPAVAVAFVCPT